MNCAFMFLCHLSMFRFATRTVHVLIAEIVLRIRVAMILDIGNSIPAVVHELGIFALRFSTQALLSSSEIL